MLRQTFLHISGIGYKTEKRIWQAGIRSWEDALSNDQVKSSGLAKGLRAKIQNQTIESEMALERKDAKFFYKLQHLGESWRLFHEFSDQLLFLDIETTGLSSVFDRITLIGLYDGKKYRVFVQGINLDEVQNYLPNYPVIVTFNGSQFDLRFIKMGFPDLTLPPIHIDLRFAAQKLGLRGGLKKIEKRLKIKRSGDVEDIDGYQATILWSRYMRGDIEALDNLIRYNKEDVVNLKELGDIVTSRLSKAAAPSATRDTKTHQLWDISNVTAVVPQLAKATMNARILTSNLVNKTTHNGRLPRIVGIDLTGSKRPTGWALLKGNEAITKLLVTDRELIEETLNALPDLVSIDSPLSLPVWRTKNGRKTRPIYRKCELALKRMGISVFWCLLPSMQSLTYRGIRLARKLRSKGVNVIESYPGAAQDILNIPRKKASLHELREGLRNLGLLGQFTTTKVSHDELDAITSALVGLFYMADECIALGNDKEDYLIIPSSPWLNTGKLTEVIASLNLTPPEKYLLHK